MRMKFLTNKIRPPFRGYFCRMPINRKLLIVVSLYPIDLSATQRVVYNQDNIFRRSITSANDVISAFLIIPRDYARSGR